jgi:two-component system, NtrC family, sensor kinase
LVSTLPHEITVKPLKLHIKTTLLVSSITIAILAGLLALVIPRVGALVNEEQRSLAELDARVLADQISALPGPRDAQMLAHASTVVRGARPNIIAVRIWTRVGGKYQVIAEAAGSEPVEPLPEETIAGLRTGLRSEVARNLSSDSKSSIYRVLAPITDDGRFSGAVELVQRMDESPRIAVQFEQTALMMAILAVVFITIATYLLFRHFVYSPVDRLLQAMGRAEAGDLMTAAPSRAPDELGLLSQGFNRMIGQIRKMTDEQSEQKAVLESRVREATAELASRNEELEERNRELGQSIRRITDLERLAAAGQTAAQFAHEVGTPLNLISGHVQLLKGRLEGDSRADSRLETISGQIERIERIVRGMLDRTRSEAVSLKPLSLGPLLAKVFDATSPELASRDVRLETRIEDDIPMISGDPDRLQQLFINLINNALDAMPSGGTIVVKVASTGAGGSDGAGWVTVEVADDGIGMTEEQRTRVFDPFFTTKGPGRGTGLGLVVVRQIVREHNAEIEVISAPGKGASFILRFPAHAAEPENTDREKERLQQV